MVKNVIFFLFLILVTIKEIKCLFKNGNLYIDKITQAIQVVLTILAK